MLRCSYPATSIQLLYNFYSTATQSLGDLLLGDPHSAPRVNRFSFPKYLNCRPLSGSFMVGCSYELTWKLEIISNLDSKKVTSMMIKLE